MSKFKPPTIEQVRAYARDKGIGFKYFNPYDFWYFYDKKGWRVGKGTMKRWKSAVTHWAIRNQWCPETGDKAGQQKRYIEQRHKKDREHYEDYLKSKGIEALEDLAREIDKKTGYAGQIPGWLIKEVINEKTT